jgi:hypothetical protein
MSTLQATFYFFFGFVSAIYVVILLFKLFKLFKHKPTNDGTAKFYLNMFFLDRKELLRNIVRSKIPRNRPLIRALSKRAAVTLLSSAIVEKVAANLCGVVPETLGRMGISSSVKIIYTKAAFVCLEV